MVTMDIWKVLFFAVLIADLVIIAILLPVIPAIMSLYKFRAAVRRIKKQDIRISGEYLDNMAWMHGIKRKLNESDDHLKERIRRAMQGEKL